MTSQEVPTARRPSVPSQLPRMLHCRTLNKPHPHRAWITRTRPQYACCILMNSGNESSADLLLSMQQRVPTTATKSSGPSQISAEKANAITAFRRKPSGSSPEKNHQIWFSFELQACTMYRFKITDRRRVEHNLAPPHPVPPSIRPPFPRRIDQFNVSFSGSFHRGLWAPACFLKERRGLLLPALSQKEQQLPGPRAE